MNYLQQKLFCLLVHSHHVGILVVQQAHGVCQNGGRTEAVFQLFVFQFGFISGRTLLI